MLKDAGVKGKAFNRKVCLFQMLPKEQFSQIVFEHRTWRR
jgi:hypothetical protein